MMALFSIVLSKALLLKEAIQQGQGPVKMFGFWAFLDLKTIHSLVFINIRSYGAFQEENLFTDTHSKMNFIPDLGLFVEDWWLWQMQEKMIMLLNFSLPLEQHQNCRISIPSLGKYGLLLLDNM